MKYDDANWHSGGDFPQNSPTEFGGTHIALYLRWCFCKGWAGEIHTEDYPELIEQVIDGTKSATEFFFEYCDGKLTDEDLSAEGNQFTNQYYGDKGLYLGDYSMHFDELCYVASEDKHDFKKFSEMVENRLQSGKLTE